ncbi:MAG: autotransporter domain-containing protein, partial [Chlamydiota bacterium]
PVNNSVIFDATGNAGVTIDGQNQFQAFLVTAGASTFQNFANLTVQNCLAKGGAGGAGGIATSNSAGSGGGGGGLGAGGAFFIFTGAEVTMAATVANLQINSCSAQGGNGGAGGGLNGGTICTG